MTVYYRNEEEEGGRSKTRPTLDYLRERSGSNIPGLVATVRDMTVYGIVHIIGEEGEKKKLPLVGFEAIIPSSINECSVTQLPRQLCWLGGISHTNISKPACISASILKLP